jgi:RNA recognition motif-containing protein
MAANATETVATAVENAEKAQAADSSTTVEAITEAVGNTSIAPKTEEEDKQETKPEGSKEAVQEEAKQDLNDAEASAHAVSAAEGRRLYIGNLAYSTTDEQLKEFFHGFSIESTSIPTNPRTGRAVGYAFVDLTTKEEADRAIEELSGKEVQERKVSVQLARKPGSYGKGAKKETNEDGATSAPEGEDHAQQGDHPKKGRGHFKSRGSRKSGRSGKRGPRGGETTETGEEAPTNVPGQVLPLVEATNVTSEASGEAAPAAAAEGSAPNAVKGKKKRRGPPENGIPSSTKIMVANLPYELSEEKLKELFQDYEPESAKIALRPIPHYMVRKLQARGEPRKGRGFGFVTLASEEMQKKAVAEMNGKEVDGREIAVKVAIDSHTENEDKENASENAPGNASEEKKSEEVQNGVAAEPPAVEAAAT